MVCAAMILNDRYPCLTEFPEVIQLIWIDLVFDVNR